MELLLGHVSVAACGADHMYSDAALMLPCCMCSDAGAVGWVCPWGVDCLDVLKPKAVDWAS